MSSYFVRGVLLVLLVCWSVVVFGFWILDPGDRCDRMGWAYTRVL